MATTKPSTRTKPDARAVQRLKLSAFIELSETGMGIDKKIPFDAWGKIGGQIGTMARASRWWVGDWWLFGEGSFGEKASQLMDATGLDYKSVVNSARTSARVAPAVRRGWPLTWSHHEEVARFDDAKIQTRWLKKAEAERWTSKQLRAAINADAGKAPSAGKKGTPLGLTIAQVQAQIRRALVEWFEQDPAGGDLKSDTGRELAFAWIAQRGQELLWEAKG